MPPCGIPLYPFLTVTSGIKHVIFPLRAGDEYLFPNAEFTPQSAGLRNFCRSDIIVLLMMQHPRLRFAQSGLITILSQASQRQPYFGCGSTAL
jgi:hypothetical protein